MLQSAGQAEGGASDKAKTLTRRRAPDLRLRFGLILGVAMLPLLVFSVWQATVDYRRDIDARNKVVETSARLSVDGLMSTISDSFTKLDVLRQTVADQDCTTEFNAVLRATREIDHLVLADSDGDYVCKVTPVSSRMQAFDLSRMLTPEAPTHIEIRRPPEGSDAPAVLMLSMGDFQNGELDRIFIAAINMSRLDDLAFASEVPDDSAVAVVARDGVTLYRSSGRFPELGPDRLREVSGARQRLRFRNPSDNRRLDVTVLGTDVPDVFTAISEPQRGLMSVATLSRLSPALLPLLAWLFAFGAIWVAADRLILSHLRRLRGAALHFASGETGARVGDLDDAPEQIGQLGRTFDLMADRITEREASLQASLDEKSVLLREIHHRVKNNLQIIISLLNMQQRELEDPRGKIAIEEARNRVGAIALVHRSLYESDDLSDVDVRPFLDQLVTDLHRSLDGPGRAVELVKDLDEAEFEHDMAIPLALFVVEAVSNAIKHGVPEGGTLRVAFDVVQHDNERKRVLTITDSGPGPGDSSEDATGWRLMRGFARQVRGEFETRTLDDGFEVRLTF